MACAVQRASSRGLARTLTKRDSERNACRRCRRSGGHRAGRTLHPHGELTNACCSQLTSFRDWQTNSLFFGHATQSPHDTVPLSLRAVAPLHVPTAAPYHKQRGSVCQRSGRVVATHAAFHCATDRMAGRATKRVESRRTPLPRHVLLHYYLRLLLAGATVHARDAVEPFRDVP